MGGKHKNISFQEKIQGKFRVNEATGCWEWIGYLDSNGYGRVNFKKKRTYAHRASYIIHKGKFPDELFVLHKCDVPRCINPDHLFLGNQADNIKDMMNKKRHVALRGENAGNSKITWEQAFEIKWLHAMGFSNKELGETYGMTRQNIGDIAANRTWQMECHD